MALGEWKNRKELHYRDGYEAANGSVIQYQAEWTKQHQLEGDGLLTLLYDHLWKSDKTKEHRLRCAWIPDTVVFEHNFPRAWYTYDSKTQEIIKRPGKLLDARSIYADFCETESGNDIVAQFYHKNFDDAPTTLRKKSPVVVSARGRSQSPRKNEGRSGSAHRHRASAAEYDAPVTAIEYFTKETLYDFMHNRKNKPDGVLQKFLLPKGKATSRANSQLQAIWSPMVTRVYKRTNNHRLNDRSCPVEERAATFDGPPHLSNESLVAHSTQKRIEAVCKEIIRHITITEHKPIVRIVLYFKVDDKDDLWVLWASSLRVGGDKLNPVHLRVPMQLDLRVRTQAASVASKPETNDAVHEEERLVDSDCSLYGLTGDWLFARSRCAGRSSNETNADNLAAITGRPASARGSGGCGVPAITGIPAPPPPPSRSESASNTAPSATAVPSPPRSARAYISPRAPFLPTMHPHRPVSPESVRHPLHDQWIAVHGLPPGGRTAAADGTGPGGGRRYGSGSGAMRGTLSSGARIPEPPKKLERLTKEARTQRALVAAAQDVVYEAYSAELETGVDGARGFDAKGGVELPQLLLVALTPDTVEALVEAMHLHPLPESDGTLYGYDAGALGRGRRQDRPSAQLMEDLNLFFESEFQRDWSGIQQRLKQHEDAQGAISVDS